MLDRLAFVLSMTRSAIGASLYHPGAVMMKVGRHGLQERAAVDVPGASGPPRDEVGEPASEVSEPATDVRGPRTDVTVSGRRERSVAVGRDVLNSTIITGDLIQVGPATSPSLSRRTWRPWLRANVWKVAATAVAVLVLAASLVQVAHLVWPEAPSLPPMSGDLNIAVAEFGVVDDQGNALDSREGAALADSLHRSLLDRVNTLRQADTPGEPFDIQIRGPSPAQRISGSNSDDRARSAGRLAEQVNAHVLIYGQLKQSTSSLSLQPEIFVALPHLRDAEELVGQHELAGAIVQRGAADDAEPRRKVREALVGRTAALADFLLGLSQYRGGNFEAAQTHFGEADRQWPAGDPKQVLYLFEGNASLRNHQLAAAEAQYGQALAENPTYARAQVGQAEVRFQQVAAGGCAAGRTDPAVLRGLISDYSAIAQDTTLSQRERESPLWSIAAKTAFGIGRASVCLSLASGENHWTEAENEFQFVVADFESGNARARALASESHANLALIALPGTCDAGRNAAYQRAAVQFTQAVDLSDEPLRQAEFYRWLGQIHQRLGELDQADQAYRKAMELDPANRALYEASRQEAAAICTAEG